MHRRAAAGKALSTLDGPRILRDSNGSWILTDSRTGILTRRHWPLAALLSTSFLAVGGAVYEYTGFAVEGGSILSLLAWIAIFLAALILIIMRFAGMAADTGQEAGIEEFADAMPVGVALYGPDGRLRHCNEPFQQAFPDPGVRAEFGAVAAMIKDDIGQPAEFGGEHNLAGGRRLRLERRELGDGAFVVTTLDVSRIAALEADFQAAGKQFRQFLSVAAEWIWETDVQHRFVMARAVGTDSDKVDFSRIKGCSPTELTPVGEDVDRLAIERCMHDMGRRRRLHDVRLTLDAGEKVVRTRLNGVPRYDDAGGFLGYRGVGTWEPAAPPGDAVTQKPRPAPVGPAGRLLLVDDSSMNRMLAVTILRNMGYEADAVPDGQQAVEAVRDGDYAAVLMDIWMPEMDGFEATAAIRNLPEPRGGTPVIAMTAHSGAEERQRCLAAGMDDHLGKPIDRAVLATILRRHAGPPAGRVASADNGLEPAGSSDTRPAVEFVNDAVLNQLRNDAGPALVSELIAAFMAETDERLVRIAAAIKAGDHEEIAADAHSLKSSSGTFGALPLQALSVRLEAAALEGDATAAAAAHDDLSAIITKTWREFAAHGYRR
jgi:CheY-like chemotaxis protein/PAS domain-containing protein